MRRAITEILVASGIDVIGEAADGEEALEKIEKRKPDVALVDIKMPRLSGVEVARRTRRSTPETAVLLYSGYGDKALLLEALDAGARGFVLKEAPLVDLHRAIKTVAEGGTYVDPVLAGALATSEVGDGLPKITQRERDVLRLLADGQIERGDRQGALHLAGDRANARAEGDGQARGGHEDGGRCEGAPSVAHRASAACEIADRRAGP